ncbi:MAG: aromatic ring-hydroxylating dioxygenase subunit alpha [Gammaproteobacteria bacterium]|nr:aromatic ring-hydroxylating dioxygenase subunit alpha [Gammaproteobacteria bacterium]
MPLSRLSETGTGLPAADKPDLRRIGIHPDFWYPLLRSKNLKVSRARAVTFAGEPIVLVRGAGGEVFALEDRCAHRQVPLSAGEVEGELIRCCYHGWTYDGAGRCVNIPYVGRSEAVPRGVRSYPCREEYGLVFVFPGDPGMAGDAPFPDVPAWHDSRYKTRYLDHEVGCHYSFLHENLMDMNHQFLHRGIMAKIKTTFLELREGDGWVEVDYTFARIGRQPVGERFMLGRRPEANRQRPHDLMTVRTEYPHQILKFWTAGSEHPALDLWISYVPVDRGQRRNRTLALMNIRRPSIPGLMEVLWPFIIWFTNGIFAEDKWVVELEQAAFDRQGADWNQEIFPVIQRTRELLMRKGIPLER